MKASVTEDHPLHKTEIIMKPSSAETQFLRGTTQQLNKNEVHAIKYRS